MKQIIKKYKVRSTKYGVWNVLYLILCTLYASLSFSQGVWVNKSPFASHTRWASTGFSIGTKGYVTSGDSLTGYSSEMKDLWEWDQPTNTWAQKANFPGTGRSIAVAFSIGAKGYLGTGWSTLQDFWEWDQATNIWTQKTSFPGTGRYAAVGFSIGTKGYIGGGCSAMYDFWEYDPATNLWTQKANYPGNSTCAPTGFSIGNKGYMGLGLSPSNEFWQYDPVTNTWTQKANFGGQSRGEAVGFSIGQYGYIGAGTTLVGSGDVSDFWKYDTLTNLWSQVANFGGGLVEMSVGFSIGCYGYVVTGLTNDMAPFNPNLWEYHDSTNTTCGTSCAVHANFQSSDTAFCSESGKCINFTNLSSPCATSWHWTFFGATPDTSSLQNPDSICYYTPGTYPVILIVSNGSSTDTLNVYPMIIFANLPPPPVITLIGGDTLISSNGSYYQWYFNGSAITGATDSFYVAHQGGTYSVQITDNLGCNSLSGGVLITATEDFSGEDGMEVYPNPAHESATLSYALRTLDGNTVIRITDVTGREIQQFLVGNKKGRIVWDTKAVANGIYLYQLRTDSGILTRGKISVQK